MRPRCKAFGSHSQVSPQSAAQPPVPAAAAISGEAEGAIGPDSARGRRRVRRHGRQPPRRFHDRLAGRRGLLFERVFAFLLVGVLILLLYQGLQKHQGLAFVRIAR